MKRVAVFDIDGTLTDTNAVDDECFVRAVGQVLGADVRGTDWATAPHVTDAAILEWLCERHCGRPLRDGEVDHARRVFLEILRSELTTNAHRFRPIPGARDVFARLDSAGWEVVVATGGWETTARLKLQAIGIDHERVPLASASDARTRTEIIAMAIERLNCGRGAYAARGDRGRRAGAELGVEGNVEERGNGEARTARAHERVVSLGDGVWDVRAAAELRLPFIGVGSGAGAERLRAAGAATVLEDLSDSDELFDALERAEVPAG